MSDGKIMRTMLARVLADTDQDMEHAAAWIRESDPDAVMHLWDLMNRDWPNPNTEVMTRFAIIGFSVVVQKVFGQEDSRE